MRPRPYEAVVAMAVSLQPSARSMASASFSSPFSTSAPRWTRNSRRPRSASTSKSPLAWAASTTPKLNLRSGNRQVVAGIGGGSARTPCWRSARPCRLGRWNAQEPRPELGHHDAHAWSAVAAAAVAAGASPPHARASGPDRPAGRCSRRGLPPAFDLRSTDARAGPREPAGALARAAALASSANSCRPSASRIAACPASRRSGLLTHRRPSRRGS